MVAGAGSEPTPPGYEPPLAGLVKALVTGPLWLQGRDLNPRPPGYETASPVRRRTSPSVWRNPDRPHSYGCPGRSLEPRTVRDHSVEKRVESVAMQIVGASGLATLVLAGTSRIASILCPGVVRGAADIGFIGIRICCRYTYRLIIRWSLVRVQPAPRRFPRSGPVLVLVPMDSDGHEWTAFP